MHFPLLILARVIFSHGTEQPISCESDSAIDHSLQKARLRSICAVYPARAALQYVRGGDVCLSHVFAHLFAHGQYLYLPQLP